MDPQPLSAIKEESTYGKIGESEHLTPRESLAQIVASSVGVER